MGQRKTVPGHDQRQHDLLAIAAVVAGIAAAGQVVLLGQSLEVGTGEIVEQQVVVELEQRPELALQIIFDGFLRFDQAIQCAVQAVLGHGAVGDTQEIFQARGLIPVFGQCEFTAGSTQAVDDLDGHDVRGPDRFLSLGHMAVDDLVEVKELPEPESEPDVAEGAGIGPADFTQADAHDVGIIRGGDVVVVGEEAELLGVTLAVVEDDGALPAEFLVVVEFAEMGHDVLTWPGLGADALDEGVVGRGLAVLGAGVAAQEHGGLLDVDDGQECVVKSRRQAVNRFSLHRSQAISTTKNPRKTGARPSFWGKNGHNLRNLG